MEPAGHGRIDGPLAGAEVLGCLGGVLGYVGSHHLGGDLALGLSGADGPDVDLRAPGEGHGPVGSAGHHEPYPAGGLVDGPVEDLVGAVDARRLVVAVGGVEADDGVEVHHAA